MGIWGRGRLKGCKESVVTNLVASTPFYNCSRDWKCNYLSGWWSGAQETWVSSGWRSDLHISAFMLLQNQALGLHAGRILEILQRLISPSEWQCFPRLLTALSKQLEHSPGLQKPLFLCIPTTHLVLCQKLVVWRTTARMTGGPEYIVGRSRKILVCLSLKKKKE